MSVSIFRVRGRDDLVPMTEASYDSEDVLQELLAKFPELLAGDQLAGADARRWVLIDREAAVPDTEQGGRRGSVDHLFLDQDSVPTLVEVKRSSDTITRRPDIPLAVFAADPEALDAFKRALDWFCETVRSHAEDLAKD